MTTWRLSTTEKKNVIEREIWRHAEKNWTVVHEVLYRWGHATLDTEDNNEPEIDLDNDDGVEIYDIGFEVETLDDGCGSEWEFPDEMAETDRQTMLDGWNDEMHCYMEDNGWEMDHSEVFFYGPLELEQI